MCNFGRKHQRYLVAMQYKEKRDRHSSLRFFTLQQSLHKMRWSSGNLTSGPIQLGM